MPTLSKNFDFLLPHAPDLARLQETLGRVEALRTAWALASERFPTLIQSILANAFRGELAPQDPNNEPASVLLERIHAERAAGADKPRRGLRKAAPC